MIGEEKAKLPLKSGVIASLGTITTDKEKGVSSQSFKGTKATSQGQCELWQLPTQRIQNARNDRWQIDRPCSHRQHRPADPRGHADRQARNAMLPGQSRDDLCSEFTTLRYVRNLGNSPIRSRINVIRDQRRLTFDDSPRDSRISPLAVCQRIFARPHIFCMSGDGQFFSRCDSSAPCGLLLLFFDLPRC